MKGESYPVGARALLPTGASKGCAAAKPRKEALPWKEAAMERGRCSHAALPFLLIPAGNELLFPCCSPFLAHPVEEKESSMGPKRHATGGPQSR